MRSSKALGRLSGEAIHLRPLTDHDLPTLERWDRDPEIIALMGRKFGGQESLEDWYRRVRSGRSCRVMAVETADGRLIGEVELDRIDWRAGAAELRVCIGEKDCWGRGYGHEALHSFLDLSFGAWGLRTVYLRVYTANRRAIRLYERLGFRARGILAPSRRRADPGKVLLMTLGRERFLRLEQDRARAIRGADGQADAH